MVLHQEIEKVQNRVARFVTSNYCFETGSMTGILEKKSKRKVQGVPQLQTATLPRHQEEEETDKTKQAQIEQTYEKH